MLDVSPHTALEKTSPTVSCEVPNGKRKPKKSPMGKGKRKLETFVAESLTAWCVLPSSGGPHPSVPSSFSLSTKLVPKFKNFDFSQIA